MTNPGVNTTDRWMDATETLVRRSERTPYTDVWWLGSMAEIPSQEYWWSTASISRVYHQQGVPSRLRHHHNKEARYHAASGCIRSPLARPLSSASPSLLENAASSHVKPPSQATFRPTAAPSRRCTEIAAVNMNFIIYIARETVNRSFRVRSDVNKDSDSLTVSTCLKLNIFVRVWQSERVMVKISTSHCSRSILVPGLMCRPRPHLSRPSQSGAGNKEAAGIEDAGCCCVHVLPERQAFDLFVCKRFLCRHKTWKGTDFDLTRE